MANDCDVSTTTCRVYNNAIAAAIGKSYYCVCITPEMVLDTTGLGCGEQVNPDFAPTPLPLVEVTPAPTFSPTKTPNTTHFDPVAVPSIVPTAAPTVVPCADQDCVNTCGDMAANGLSMECFNFGDPHFTTFSGKHHSAMGQGEYVLVRDRNLSFTVHSCQQPLPEGAGGPAASETKGVAVRSQWGIMKFMGDESHLPTPPTNSGIRIKEHTPMFGVNQITFPSGEVLEIDTRTRSTRVRLGPSYCDQIFGLCGAYDPVTDFASTFTVNDALMPSGSVFDGSSVERWGGMYGGEFQSVWAESWKVSPDVTTAADGANADDAADGAMFTSAECPSADPYSGPPPEPFSKCPDLEDEAKLKCPKDPNDSSVYDGCVADVGITCEMDWTVPACESSPDLPECQDGDMDDDEPPAVVPSPVETHIEMGACTDHKCDPLTTTCKSQSEVVQENIDSGRGFCATYDRELTVWVIPATDDHACAEGAPVGGPSAPKEFPDERSCAKECQVTLGGPPSCEFFSWDESNHICYVSKTCDKDSYRPAESDETFLLGITQVRAPTASPTNCPPALVARCLVHPRSLLTLFLYVRRSSFQMFCSFKLNLLDFCKQAHDKVIHNEGADGATGIAGGDDDDDVLDITAATWSLKTCDETSFPRCHHEPDSVSACYDTCQRDETCENFAFSSEEYMVNGEPRVGVCVLMQDVNSDVIKAMCPSVREEGGEESEGTGEVADADMVNVS
jgi:hypothetical protein